MLFTPISLLLAASALFTGAAAAPLEERASPKCVTYLEGSLTTGNITSELRVDLHSRVCSC